MTVPAHDQAVTRHYVVRYPDHPERKSDPHYADFNSFRHRTHKTAQCAIGLHRNDFTECGGQLELHHTHVEFALQNGIDLAWLEADYPGISNPDSVGAWVESATNLTWLCLLPDVPVRMADGLEKAISEVRLGDLVMTHDGTAQPVLATYRKPYRGEVFRIGSAYLTPTHRVLTHRGWLSAAEIEREVRMHGPHVILLRCEEEQVFRGVVHPVAVDVMDALAGGQGPSNDLLHDPAVLHDMPWLAVDVNQDANVALSGNGAPTSVTVLPRRGVQTDQAARIGAVVDLLDPVVPNVREFSACAAGEVDTRAGVTSQLATGGAARAAASGVSPSDAFGRKKPDSASDAVAFNQRSTNFYGGWYTLREVRRIAYAGYVHDITVANSHSFVAAGTVVHNCLRHHRGDNGIHVLSSADFEAQKYVKGLIE